ncbi:hypothetical protein D9M69_715580 [compost metagenome]
MQALDPLRIVDVGLAPGHRAGIAGIGQDDLQPATLQNLVDRNPIHPGRLHRHRGDSEANQPGRHLFQVSRESLEGPHRFLGEVDRHRDHMEARTDIDAGCTIMNDRQAAR